jgi:hypothetical protein
VLGELALAWFDGANEVPAAVTSSRALCRMVGSRLGARRNLLNTRPPADDSDPDGSASSVPPLDPRSECSNLGPRALFPLECCWLEEAIGLVAGLATASREAQLGFAAESWSKMLEGGSDERDEDMEPHGDGSSIGDAGGEERGELVSDRIFGDCVRTDDDAAWSA